MKYKIGDEVVLKKKEGIKEELKGKEAEIVALGGMAGWIGKDYTMKVEGRSRTAYGSDDDIDHEKTAELHKKNKAFNHYQGELEKIVEQRNNDEYTEALMKYGRREGDNLDVIKPKHYYRGLDDLIEGWYRTQPWNEWRTSMVNLAERYFRRDKNDPVEDIEKGIFVINRVKEKEIERRET